MSAADLVVLDTSPDEGGLAPVLADLIRGNLERSPGREALVRAMKGSAVIVADDGTERVEAMLRFDRETVRVCSGVSGGGTVTVRGTYDAVLALTLVPMLGLLPMPWSLGTWAMFGAMVRGKVKVEGLLSSPGFAMRMLALMSVAL